MSGKGDLNYGCSHEGREKWADSGYVLMYDKPYLLIGQSWIMRESKELRKTEIFGPRQWKNGAVV